MKIWDCKIGPVDEAKLPPGADAPLRKAVIAAFKKMTGEEPQHVFSGFGAELDEAEQEFVESHK